MITPMHINNRILPVLPRSLVFVLMLFMFSFSVSAYYISPLEQQIFFEGFESGTLNNWSIKSNGCLNWSIISSDKNNGTYSAQSNPQCAVMYGSVIEQNISLADWQNITIRFFKKCVALDASGDVYEVAVGDIYYPTYTSSGMSCSDASFVERIESFVSGTFDFDAVFPIRASCTANQAGEYCRLDDFYVYGVYAYPVMNLTAPMNITYNTTATQELKAPFNLSVDKPSNCSYALNGGTSVNLGVGTNFYGNLSSLYGGNYVNFTCVALSSGRMSSKAVSYSIWHPEPNVSILYPLSSYYNITSLSLIVYVPENASCWHSLNGGSNVSMIFNGTMFNADISGIEEKNKVVVSCNESNNLWSFSERYFFIDTSIPQLVVYTPQNNMTYHNYTLMLDFFAYDNNLTGVWYVLNEDAPISIHSNTSIVAKEGINVLKVYADDLAGNRNTTTIVFDIYSLYYKILECDYVKNPSELTKIDLDFICHNHLVENYTCVNLVYDVNGNLINSAPYQWVLNKGYIERYQSKRYAIHTRFSNEYLTAYTPFVFVVSCSDNSNKQIFSYEVNMTLMQFKDLHFVAQSQVRFKQNIPYILGIIVLVVIVIWLCKLMGWKK